MCCLCVVLHIGKEKSYSKRQEKKRFLFGVLHNTSDMYKKNTICITYKAVHGLIALVCCLHLNVFVCMFLWSLVEFHNYSVHTKRSLIFCSVVRV